ncbi:MAG TPA: ABC transporter permease [Thermoanaerobaculia bacterium]
MNTRSMYWSLRRELWENRSIYIAPLAVAAVMVFGFFIAAIAALGAKSVKLDAQPDKLAQPFNLVAVLMMATTFIVAIFYCLDALHGERRDRSVLFWKSMPVSDVTTVLSKAAIPLVVLPLITFVLTIATQIIMLLLGSAVALISGHSAAALWTKLPWFQMSGMLLYHLLSVHSLYYAPIFGWLLFVSAWAKRAPILWAVLPLFAIGIVEKIAFNTSYLGAMLASRISGGANDAGMRGGVMMLGHFNLGEFLSSPGLWIGLALMAAFLAGAVLLRRYRAPI